MNREEAIQALKDLAEMNVRYGCDDKWITALHMAIEALSAKAEWIPCSERLPNAEYGEGDSVLCCTESGLMYILYWNGGNWCASTGEPYHWVNHKTGWHDKVIAWMPLPKPYREGDEV